MAKFAVYLFAPAPADPMAMSPEELAAHEAFGTKLDELGGKIIDGLALHASTEAVSIRGGKTTNGGFTGKDVLAGTMILEARDRDHAVEIATHVPAASGVEVRPLFDPPAE